jgi:hypothetical protein
VGLTKMVPPCCSLGRDKIRCRRSGTGREGVGEGETRGRNMVWVLDCSAGSGEEVSEIWRWKMENAK